MRWNIERMINVTTEELTFKPGGFHHSRKMGDWISQEGTIQLNRDIYL